jgi:hypothetical protein
MTRHVPATKAPPIPPAAVPFGQRVVQYRRLRRAAKIDLLHLANSYGVTVPSNHFVVGDPSDPAVTAAVGPAGTPQPLSRAERVAIARILRARTSKKLLDLHTVIPPSVYASGPVSAFESAQGRLIVADLERENAYNNYCVKIGRPLPPGVKPGASKPPSDYKTVTPGVSTDFWGAPLAAVGGTTNPAGHLECGAPQTGHGVEGEPCNCRLGEDLVCHYHP